MLNSDDVKHIAKLAKLNLSEEEVEKYRNQLSQIIDYLDVLKKVDTSNVKTKTHSYNHLEANYQSLTQDAQKIDRNEALKNAKNHTEKYFVTDSVL